MINVRLFYHIYLKSITLFTLIFILVFSGCVSDKKPEQQEITDSGKGNIIEIITQNMEFKNVIFILIAMPDLIRNYVIPVNIT